MESLGLAHALALPDVKASSFILHRFFILLGLRGTAVTTGVGFSWGLALPCDHPVSLPSVALVVEAGSKDTSVSRHQ